MIDLMLIVPHPDDEVFGSGGMFSKMSSQGKRVATLTLTRGGAGRTLGLCKQAELADRREEELRASLAILGVEDVHIWDYPDFVPDTDRNMPLREGLQAISQAELLPKITKLITDLAPKSLLTFPPNGSNGHPDHVTTHTLVTEALKHSAHKVQSLYYFASDTPYKGEARPGFLAPEEIAKTQLPPTHYVDIKETLALKLKAMGQHKTQALSVLNFMAAFTERILTESFHLAGQTPENQQTQTVMWL